MNADQYAHWDLFLCLKFRQDWQNSGYGLGDLIYTTSLLPNEEQTLEVKTWETDRRIEELTKDVSEKNTSDIKSTKSSSREVTDRHESKEHAYVDAKASYAGFGASAEVKAGWSSDVADMNKQIAKAGSSSMEKAANEERASKKTKLAISREIGAESKTTRRIRNINQTHTLNANFFEVLQEYNVVENLYEIRLVLLGAHIHMNQPAHTETWRELIDPDDLENRRMSWAKLLEGSKNSDWVRRFTDVNGHSPIPVLYQMWSKNLLRAALPEKNWSMYPEDDPVRLEFQAKMLQFTRPSEGWLELDHEGVFRWAYEVPADVEREFLEFIQPFLITSPQEWLEIILGDLAKLRKEQEGPVAVDGKKTRTVVLPTQGIYADVSLGICSGGEDFIEVNRHFDLELKRLEIDKLKLEVKRLELENAMVQSGENSKVVIENASDKTSINVDVDAKQPTSIELKNSEQ